MIVDAFLEWAEQAPRERRVEAADALARSYLHSPLGDDERRKVMTGLFALLDDQSIDVRERIADVFADRRDAPRPLVLRLIDDVPAVSTLLFARSPLLHDTHLLEGLQRAEPRIEQAIASRIGLTEALVNAILSDAGSKACCALVGNPHVRLGDSQTLHFIDRFAGDVEALETLQATRNLPPEHLCLLVSAAAQAYQENTFVQALVPEKRLNRLTDAARERAILDVLMQLDSKGCYRAIGALYPVGGLTPALVLRVALCGQVPALEAMVARLCDVSMERVRSAFMHSRPVVAASLLKKTGLSEPVCSVISMALVMARELAGAQVDWTPAFFAETLIEVVDQRSAQALYEDVAGALPDDATVGLCHSIAADIMQAEARSQALPQQAVEFDLDSVLDVDSTGANVDALMSEALAA